MEWQSLLFVSAIESPPTNYQNFVIIKGLQSGAELCHLFLNFTYHYNYVLKDIQNQGFSFHQSKCMALLIISWLRIVKKLSTFSSSTYKSLEVKMSRLDWFWIVNLPELGFCNILPQFPLFLDYRGGWLLQVLPKAYQENQEENMPWLWFLALSRISTILIGLSRDDIQP